jgi:type I restriction enzyme R subunit
MRETDMAVVVSEESHEAAVFAEKGIDIAPHRRRMKLERLDDRFKDPDDPLRMVFVTAMWLTGFDVPSLATIYLDKPMRNHGLMQTIARANRVFEGKPNGMIVDYVGLFRDLERALAIYAAGGEDGRIDLPVAPKTELVEKLRRAIAETDDWLRGLGVNLDEFGRASGFDAVALLDRTVEKILVNDETKREFFGRIEAANVLFKAILPDPAAQEFVGALRRYRDIEKKIRVLRPVADIEGVRKEVEALLDASISTEGYVIRESEETGVLDLRSLDLAKLEERFAKGRERAATEELRGAIERALKRLVELNRTRMDYQERFERLIDEYNAGARNVQTHFEELLRLARELDAEEQRAIAEGLTEEELAVFDLLTKPGPALTAKEEDRVKQVAQELLATLKRNRLVLDWRKKQAARAAVQVAITRALGTGLPGAYSNEEKRAKSEVVYQHVYDAYWGQGRSVYWTGAGGSQVE